MENNTVDVSYIIAFRAENIERVDALIFVLKKLRGYFPKLEILVVEQDSEPKLELDENLKVKHIFVFNSGLFNKSWAFNIAVKNTQKPVFAFGDADIFLEKEDYLTCFAATKNFEAIVSRSENRILQYERGNTSPLFNIFAEGFVLLPRKGFEKIGGWDERFEAWGCEDHALSHLVYSTLTSKTYYFAIHRINPPHSEAVEKAGGKYEENRNWMEEIMSMNEAALLRYLQYLQNQDKGNPDKYRIEGKAKEESNDSKPLKFVLAITTFNRLDYLKACIQSFLETRTSTPPVSWEIIVADDGSTDGTKAYLAELQSEHPIHIIHNKRTRIHHQVNTILRYLSNREFDVCFKCDEDVIFQKSGWDMLYWQTIERTGYQHLIYYDKNWRPYSNLQPPITCGYLTANCTAENIQGAFYTLTKEVIEKVGYFDTQRFGRSGLGHVDYSFRCCRAGFNVLKHPFDVKNSNDFIRLQNLDSYMGTLTSKYKSLFNSKEIKEYKKRVMRSDRKYIPFNENIRPDGEALKEKNRISQRVAAESVGILYKKADATFYPERGIGGFVGFLLKRLYNLSIEAKLYFIPNTVKAVGRFLNKTSIDLMKIDD